MSNSISLGTIYATIALNLQQLQADAKTALATLDEVKAQASDALTGSFTGAGGAAKTALSEVGTEAQSAASAIGEVGAAGAAAGEAAAAGGEKAAAGLRGAGAAATEGAGGVGEFLGKVTGIVGTIGVVELAAQGFEMLRDKVTEALQAGMQANQVAAQTVAGLKSTHDASGQTAQSIDDLSTHIMQMTGIDDDAVHSAANMLLTFTNIGKDVFPQATQAVADLATKMARGAVPSAIQMQQASIQLGKALGDPLKGYTALQRVGVTFTAQQKEQIKNFVATGDVAGAQNVILKEMNKEFGGSAVAAGQANGGIAILRAELENTTQTIGQALIPVVTALTGALMPLAQWAGQVIPQAIQFLTQHADEVKIVLAALGIAVSTVVIPALVGLIAPLFAADGAIGGLVAGLGTVGLPVIAVAAALIGLGLAFKHAYDTSAPFKKAIDGLLEQVKGLAGLIVGNLQDAFARIMPYLQQAASWVGGQLTAAFDAIVPYLTAFTTGLARASGVIAVNVEPVVRSLTDRLIGLFQWIGGTAVPAIQRFAQAFEARLGPILQQVAGWVQNTLLPALQRFGGWITGTALPAVEGFARTLATRLGPILQQVGAWIQTSVLPALRQFGGFLLTQVWPAVQQAAAALRQFADDLATRLGPALTTIGGFISGFASILMTVLKPVAEVVFGALVIALIGLKDLWMAIWPGLQQVLVGVWEAIKGVVQTAWAIVAGIVKIGLDLLSLNWSQAWNDLKDMLSGVWDGIKGLLSGAWDILKGLFQAQGAVLAGIWNAIWTGIQNSVGGFFSGIQQMLISAMTGIRNGFINGFKPVLQALAHLPGPVGDMAKKALGAIDSLEKGTNAKTQAMATTTAVHAGAMKASMLARTAEMHLQAAAHFDQMRKDILTQLANTTDPAKRHALQIKLDQVTAAEDAERQASAHYAQLAHNVVTQTKTMRDQASQHAKQTSAGVTAPFGGLGATVGGFFDALGTTIHGKLTDLQQWLAGRWNAVKQTVHDVWQGISDWVRQKLDDLRQWAHQKVQPIIDAVSGPMTWLKGFISGVWNFITGVFRVVGDILAALMKKAWDKISGVVTHALTALKQWLSDRWSEISARVEAVWTTIRDTLKKWWDKITQVVNNALAPLKQWLSDRWDEIHQKITSVWTTIHDDIAKAWGKITSTIQDKANDLKNAILKPFNDAKSAIGGVVKGFGNAAIKELNQVITGWQDLGNDLGSAINNVAKAVGVSDRVPTLQLPTIPLLARGTANHPGGLAVVGEEGPELVDLPRGSRVLPAGPTAGLLSGLGGLGGLSGLARLVGLPGYAGGVGDFVSNLGGHIRDATGALAALLREGPAAIIAHALAALTGGAHNPAGAPGIFGAVGGGALSTLTSWSQSYVKRLLDSVSASQVGNQAAQAAGRFTSHFTGFANGGVLREAVAGVGVSSGSNYLLGERGPEAVVPLSRLGGGVHIEHLEVTVAAAPADGEPYQAGVAFGNGFAAGFQQARTQRGL